MIKFQSTYIFLVLTVIMTSCYDAVESLDNSNGYIQLSASTGSLVESSRAYANPFEGTTPSKTKPLNTSVWFSTEDGVYSDNPDDTYHIPVHTSVNFDGSDMKYVYYNGNNLLYPVDNKPVYCIGLYPNDNEWSQIYDQYSDQHFVEHDIDGSTDLMFSKPIIGTWSNHFEHMQYEHALTWIKIAVCAVSFNALEAWGDLEQISIRSKSTVQINTKKEVGLVAGTENTYKLEDRYHYIGEDQWIDTRSSVIPITSIMKEVGSVFCSPATEYELSIKTTKNDDPVKRTVQLRWPLEDDNIDNVKYPERARGNCFVISLYFHPYNVITAACTLDKWNPESDDIYLN